MSTSVIVAPRRPLILAACMLALFMAAVEATIVATAIPSIVADLGGFALFGWVFAVYLLAQAVTVPIYGRLADLFGRRRVIVFGITLFLAGSTLCGFAPSMLWLILFRALQGLGAGAIMPVAMTIIADIYTPTERARVQGYLSSVWGFSAVIGPLLGAFIVEHLSWSLVFWINLPIGVAALSMLGAFLPPAATHRPHAIDWRGAVLMVLAVGILMGALLQASRLGWWIIPMLAVSAVSFVLLLAQERSAAEPMLPLGLWRNHTILAGNIGGLAIGASMMGISAFLPTYIQGVMQRGALSAGIVLAAMSIGWPICSALSGRLMLATSYRTASVAGGALLVLGSAALVLLNPGRGMPWATVAAFLVGGGMGMSNSAFMVAIQSAADHSVRGIATASAVFSRMLGSSLGTAILGAVLNLSLAHGAAPYADPVQTLMESQAHGSVSPETLALLAGEVGLALHLVFIGGLMLACIALGVAWLMPGGTRPGDPSDAPRR